MNGELAPELPDVRPYTSFDREVPAPEILIPETLLL